MYFKLFQSRVFKLIWFFKKHFLWTIQMVLWSHDHYLLIVLLWITTKVNCLTEKKKSKNRHLKNKYINQEISWKYFTWTARKKSQLFQHTNNYALCTQEFPKRCTDGFFLLFFSFFLFLHPKIFFRSNAAESKQDIQKHHHNKPNKLTFQNNYNNQCWVQP